MDNVNEAPTPEAMIGAIKGNYELILDLGMRVDALTSRLEALESRVDSVQFGRLPALESARDRFTPTPEGDAAVPRTAPEQTGRIQEQLDAGWLTGGQRIRALEGRCGHCGKSYHKPEQGRDDDPGAGAYMMGRKAP